MFPIIKEGTSGVLELAGPFGGSETWFPHNDLERPMELLRAIWEVRDAEGKKLKDNYWSHGYNWLSSQVNFLFWRVLFRYAQYGELLERLSAEGRSPLFRSKLNFARIWDMMHPPRTLRPWRKEKFVRDTVVRNEALSAGGERGGVLFYRYGPGDFRSKDMLRVFTEKETPFTYCFSPSRKLLRKTAEQAAGEPDVYFLYRDLDAPRLFDNEYDLSGFEGYDAEFIRRAIEVMELRMSANVMEYQLHKKNLERMKPDVFFGIDDANEVYPVIFACKDLGIPTIGYQLGMYAERQCGYTIPGWKRGEYQWFDKVVSWGEYWEDVLLRNTEVHDKEYFLPGANKLAYNYNRLESDKFNEKNILIPYEFWGNTKLLGQYIVKLMDRGYTVYFKFKPDQRPYKQLDSYYLPDSYRERIVEVMDITDEIMAEINVVAGAMTTLLYDLLPYGKHTWVLDTEFRLLDDMVADGLAQRIRLQDIDSMPAPVKADCHMDYTTLYRDMTLDEALGQHVLPYVSRRGGE